MDSFCETKPPTRVHSCSWLFSCAVGNWQVVHCAVGCFLVIVLLCSWCFLVVGRKVAAAAAERAAAA